MCPSALFVNANNPEGYLLTWPGAVPGAPVDTPVPGAIALAPPFMDVPEAFDFA
jgi:hypothetical protein